MAEVHDELVVDTPEEDVPWVKEAMEAAMTQAPLMRELWPDTKGLMLAVEMGEGRSWAGK
jgi:DNA polymerase I-like protein with 3'-5' exonuclease and polymerase domains